MRILHLVNDVINNGNGIVNVAIDLACVQRRHGHEVTVASAGGSHEPLLCAQDVRHLRIPLRRRPMHLIRSIIELAQLVGKFDPDVVHAHMVTGAVLAWPLKWAGRFALVTTVHNEFQKSAILMGLADMVIVVSETGAKAMEHRGIRRAKIRMVHNGPLGSPRRADTLSRTPARLQHPAIVTAAGLYRRKGIGDLIAAFSMIAPDLPAAHLYIVGEGPDRAQFEREAAASEVRSRIHFEGFYPFPEDYMRAADVFVLPSHVEAFGLVLAEARAAGTAVIGTAVGGIPEVLEFGKAGLLVPPRNFAALAMSLRMVLTDRAAMEHWRRQAAGNLGWLTVERVYSQTQAVYHDAMKEGPAHATHHRHAAPLQ